VCLDDTSPPIFEAFDDIGKVLVLQPDLEIPPLAQILFHYDDRLPTEGDKNPRCPGKAASPRLYLNSRKRETINTMILESSPMTKPKSNPWVKSIEFSFANSIHSGLPSGR